MEASKRGRLSTRKITPVVTEQLNGSTENFNEAKFWTSIFNIAVTFLNVFVIIHESEMFKVIRNVFKKKIIPLSTLGFTAFLV